MDYFQIFITTVFLFINTWIVLADIRERKIPNILLLALLGILPFWIWAYSPVVLSAIVSHILLSGVLLIGGIFLYKENRFLGSGDIKYAAILILFLGTHPLSIFIGNIAILTLICLFLWIMFIIGYLYGYRRGFEKTIVMKYIFPTIKKNEIYLYILAYILDFGIVGFMIIQLIPQLGLMVSQGMTMNTDIYFLIFLIVYMIRPWSNYLITRWKYNIVPILLICIFFGRYIQENGISTLYSEILTYISSLWFYIILYICIRYVSSTIYKIYDHLNIGGERDQIKTIPYSVIIFIALIVTYSFDIGLKQWFSTIF